MKNRRLRDELSNRPLKVCGTCQQPHKTILERIESGCADPDAFPHIQNPRKRAYLIAIVECVGIKGKAAKRAGIGKYTPYEPNWKNDVEFQTAMTAAEAMATDAMEDVLIRRAIRGEWKSVGWYKGEAGGRELDYDTNALHTLLKARNPDRFRPDGNVQIVNALANVDPSKLSNEQIARIRAGESVATVLFGKAEALPPGREVNGK